MIDTGAGGSCPRCGAPVEPGQEYCLDCGSRLPGGSLVASAGAAWERRVGRRPPAWLWPLALGLVVAAAMAGVAILISQGEEIGASPIVATGPSTIPAPGTETEPEPAPPAETAPTEPEPAPTETAAPEPPPRPELVDWPPSQNGYTIVIASIPTGQGRATAIAKAREVLRSDLPEVGVLDSGEYSSLHPGYYVVFSGIYEGQRGALQAVPRVQRLYPAAYVRQISR